MKDEVEDEEEEEVVEEVELEVEEEVVEEAVKEEVWVGVEEDVLVEKVKLELEEEVDVVEVEVAEEMVGYVPFLTLASLECTCMDNPHIVILLFHKLHIPPSQFL